MIITAFQTLDDRDNIDVVETEGPFICMRSDAWLGHGYYFWDTEIAWAHDWGKKGYGNKYIVCRAQIEINEHTFDLVGNMAQKRQFAEIMELIKAKSSNDIKITVPKAIEYMKRYVGFDYNSIRAADYPNSVKKISFGSKFGESMFLGEQVQVCLINKNNLILQSFKVAFPDIYMEHQL